MTATPIPRTLTLAFYGDLDVSLIDEMPAGRRPVRTSLASRADAHLHLADHLAAGGQAYVVCPAIEALQPSGGESRVGGSRVLGPGLLDPRLSDPRLPSGSEAGPEQALPWFGEEPSGKRELTSVVALAEELKKGPLRPYQVEMLHGQMSREEKEEILSGFREGKIQALVATTVIEVGVDVPSATLMVVEDAERFGLAQLHQLRGRVGRGEAASTCLLVVNSTSPETAERLRVLLDTNDGFRIAEEDLRLRGPGEFYGLRQHGLPELGAANLLTDLDILIEARQEADGLLARDPTLARPEHFLLRAATEGRPALLDRA
jgi:ATP-dependent DNA helicase RecG